MTSDKHYWNVYVPKPATEGEADGYPGYIRIGASDTLIETAEIFPDASEFEPGIILCTSGKFVVNSKTTINNSFGGEEFDSVTDGDSFVSASWTTPGSTVGCPYPMTLSLSNARELSVFQGSQTSISLWNSTSFNLSNSLSIDAATFSSTLGLAIEVSGAIDASFGNGSIEVKGAALPTEINQTESLRAAGGVTIASNPLVDKFILGLGEAVQKRITTVGYTLIAAISTVALVTGCLNFIPYKSDDKLKKLLKDIYIIISTLEALFVVLEAAATIVTAIVLAKTKGDAVTDYMTGGSRILLENNQILISLGYTSYIKIDATGIEMNGISIKQNVLSAQAQATVLPPPPPTTPPPPSSGP